MRFLKSAASDGRPEAVPLQGWALAQGTFIAEDDFEGRPILSRGVWRRVNADEVIWEQASSIDKGSNWELNWHMRFERIKG